MAIGSLSGPGNGEYLAYGTQPSSSTWSLNNVDDTTTIQQAGDQAPAIAWTGSLPVIAAAGTNGDLYYWHQVSLVGTSAYFWLRETRLDTADDRLRQRRHDTPTRHVGALIRLSPHIWC
jgi:hypothetical protein